MSGVFKYSDALEKAYEKVSAGILFRTPDSQFLLVKRSDNGLWENPGGHAENNESPRETAVRECIEEVGQCPIGTLRLIRRNEYPGGIYNSYIQDVAEPFVPTLNFENTEYMWAQAGELPENIHPEVMANINMLAGLPLKTELDVAKAMQMGAISSPQQFESLFLFNVRVTGTGVAHRQVIKDGVTIFEEFVYRPPEKFLTPEFVERCNGILAVFLHPDDPYPISTEQFREHAIGTIILPYIQGAEVWGIAKVYDESAAILMVTTHRSTSPCVFFRDQSVNETIEIEGQKILIEGDPTYIEHLAICEQGVWDKGGPPTGINNNGEIYMTDNKDQAPAWADSLLKSNQQVLEVTQGLAKRMDSVEAKMDSKESEEEEKKPDAECEDNKKMDSEGEAEDKAKEEEKKSDADDETKKELAQIKADSAKRDALYEAKINALQNSINVFTSEPSHEEREELALIQRRADSVAQMLGETITGPIAGEKPKSYRTRLANKFKAYSPKFKEVKFDSAEFSNDAVFTHVENQIYADAEAASRNLVQSSPGKLFKQVKKDAAGREITTWHGDPKGWMGSHSLEGEYVRLNQSMISSNNRGAA